MRRLLAVVAAAGMVVASVAIRSRLESDGPGGSHTLRLTCSQELDQVCARLGDRLHVSVEAAATTADRLAAATGDPDLDGWLVPEPWPQIVDARRQARALPPLFSERQLLARSPLVLVVWKDREAALAQSRRCPAQVDWKCLGDAVAAGPWTASGGRPEWGPVKPGHAPPTDAMGLLVLGQAVAGFFGRTDLSTIDLDDDAFQGWFGALERATPPVARSPLEPMLTLGSAAFDAVGTLEAEAGPVLAQAARRSQLDLLYPAPMATADVVLAIGSTGRSAASLKRAAAGDPTKRALAEAGWRVGGQPLAQGVAVSPALPPTDGLPPPGLLDALRGRWREVTNR